MDYIQVPEWLNVQKRLSLPFSMRISQSSLEKVASKSPELLDVEQPLSYTVRRNSLQELGFGKAESYCRLEKLGEGTYATVYKGMSRLTQCMVALKVIRMEKDEGTPCTAIREISILKNLRHANIVTLHDVIHGQSSLTLVFEYLENDLKKFLDNRTDLLPVEDLQIFLAQILRGLGYIHERNILHRDLKPQNLLINSRCELKIADFGLARATSVPSKLFSNEVVTLWYRPAEVLLGSNQYNYPLDMWGVGCIFYEMVTGKPMFPGQNVDNQLSEIFSRLGMPSSDEWPDFDESKVKSKFRIKSLNRTPLQDAFKRINEEGLELINSFLSFDTTKRPTAREALTRSFFNSMLPELLQLRDDQSIFALSTVREPMNFDEVTLFVPDLKKIKQKKMKGRLSLTSALLK
ncbi:cyclin-dependent kinase 17-like isoform X2 [Symsagittifera roscoffensis]|uniref:cyclin-dependent kinase 17-like isoform X2 n=1 Tax=Symsagittifera roscoffensis TaxID=84072 RepID=UPI00307BF351